MPCNHFIMTNRNSNGVPCEPSRGKIELTVNCSCLGNGEEENRGRWRKGEGWGGISGRKGKTRGGLGPLWFLAGFLVSVGSVECFTEDLWFRHLLANDANAEI